jgi:hypothetical protein
VGISLYIRMMQESPLFTKLKSTGRVSKNPITEAISSLITLPIGTRFIHETKDHRIEADA